MFGVGFYEKPSGFITARIALQTFIHQGAASVMEGVLIFARK